MTIEEKIDAMIEELDQLIIDAGDIDMTGAEHKMQEARGSLISAKLAAKQWNEFS